MIAKQTVLTRKIKLIPIGDKEQKCRTWEFVRNQSNIAYKAANMIMASLYSLNKLPEQIAHSNNDDSILLTEIDSKIKLLYPDKSKNKEEIEALKKQKYNIIDKYKDLAKDVLGFTSKSDHYKTQIQTYIQGRIRNEFPLMYPRCNDLIMQRVSKDYDNNISLLYRGERSLNTYKKGYPFPADKKCNLNIYEDGGQFYLKAFYKSDSKAMIFKIELGRDRMSVSSELKKILSGEYSFSGCSFQLKEKDIFWLLPIKMPEKEKKNYSGIMGIDLGISSPLYYAVHGTPNRGQIGNSHQVIEARNTLRAKKRATQKAAKFGIGGKGRKIKLKQADKIRDKERRTIDTFNKQFAAEVAKLCNNHKVGTVVMEDLSGFGNSQLNDYILSRWGYYQLQATIENVCKREGISVVKVEPQYTSKCCHECGEIGNRDGKDFYCENVFCSQSGERQDADANASRNIANRFVEGKKSSTSKKKILAY